MAVANVTRVARKLAASAGTTSVVSPRRTKRREPRARRDESMSARLCSRKETRFADSELYSTGSKQNTGTMKSVVSAETSAGLSWRRRQCAVKIWIDVVILCG